MPHHVHLVVIGQDANADAWRMVVDFKQRTGFWLARNHLEFQWQKDFHDHVIRRSDDVAVHVRYMLDNPVRKGLVGDWSEYPYRGALGCTLEDVLGGLS